jgi:hypothetical protein
MLDFVKAVMMSWLTFFCSLQRKSRLGLWEQIIGGKTTATFIFLAQFLLSTEILFFISQLVGALAKCSPISKIEISSNFLIPLKYHSPIKLHFVSIFAT